jgi:hypothetical protein
MKPGEDASRSRSPDKSASVSFWVVWVTYHRSIRVAIETATPSVGFRFDEHTRGES